MPDLKTPLGVTNCNPLNVRAFHETWDGQTGEESGYVKFSKPEFGVRAAGIILLGYQKRGKNSLRAIIATFAPPSENSTTIYIENVSKWTGWGADDALDLSNLDTLVTLLKAMSRQEVGPGRFPDSVFETGAKLALEKKRIKPTAERVKEGVAAASGAAAVAQPINDALGVLQPLTDYPVIRYVVLALVVASLGLAVWSVIRRR
jgi:hypothetical protein